MGNNIVLVTCYGKTKEMKRSDAKRKYYEAILCSEGSEQSRYTKILSELLAGLDEVSDEY